MKNARRALAQAVTSAALLVVASAPAHAAVVGGEATGPVVRHSGGGFFSSGLVKLDPGQQLTSLAGHTGEL